MLDKKILLLVSASEDLNAANCAHSRGRYSVTAYLSHQIIEKSLKTAKKFQNVNDSKDLWTHNLIDCVNWNFKLKNKYEKKLIQITNDQHESRYFNVNDNILPWEKYGKENTFEKLNLAREIFAVSLGYMEFPYTENCSLIEYSHNFRKPNSLNKLIYEVIINLKNTGDYEIDFINSLNEVLISKNRFYHDCNFSPLLNEIQNDFEGSLSMGPEYNYPVCELIDNYMDMYDYLISNFKIKKINNEKISKNFLEIARYDLVTSHVLNYDGFTNLSLFYASQSIEKSLKSILNLKTKDPYMTGHDLIELCKLCGLKNLVYEIEDNELLNRYKEYRYNDGKDMIENYDERMLCLAEVTTIAEKIYFTALHIRKKYNL